MMCPIIFLLMLAGRFGICFISFDLVICFVARFISQE